MRTVRIEILYYPGITSKLAYYVFYGAGTRPPTAFVAFLVAPCTVWHKQSPGDGGVITGKAPGSTGTVGVAEPPPEPVLPPVVGDVEMGEIPVPEPELAEGGVSAEEPLP